MDAVVRAVAMYLFLLVVFRVAGKRTLSETTTFDFVLLLIISEAIQPALIANDSSMTNAFLLVTTLLGIDIVLSLWKLRSRRAQQWTEGEPLLIVADGCVLPERLRTERVDEEDILAAARELQGLERLDQIKYAVLECNGRITIVPREKAG